MKDNESLLDRSHVYNTVEAHKSSRATHEELHCLRLLDGRWLLRVRSVENATTIVLLKVTLSALSVRHVLVLKDLT